MLFLLFGLVKPCKLSILVLLMVLLMVLLYYVLILLISVMLFVVLLSCKMNYVYSMRKLFQFYGFHVILPNMHHSFRQTSLKDIHYLWNSRCAYLSPKLVYWFKRIRKSYYESVKS